jgi:NhaP-type Na+/H+ or K+/H+ antiporter
VIDESLTAIAVILGVAAACQLVASRLNLPSVLFLLVAGVALSGVVDPDEILGDLLFTGVGLGVAVLLFEGGTGLHWDRLRQGKEPVLRLVTIGAAIAWAVGTGAALLFLDVETEIAVLLGAILIVSGPTVVMPLLRVVRPRQPTSSILRWEGILIDPVGAGIAIVVLDAIIEQRSPGRIMLQVVATFVGGLAVGAAAAWILLAGLRLRLVADHLQIPATLATLVGAYAASNAIRPEAGLIAATVLGMAFANQRRAPAAHIAEFNENLGSIILGVLFIVLGARVDLDAIVDYLPASVAIIGALVLVARPASVLASTLGTGLSWRDRWFLMTLAPRGVVAAAVASLFALELEAHGTDPGPLVPVVFTVVVGTVMLTSVGARFAAGRLRVARPDPTGVALIGGGDFAVELASALQSRQVPTIHVGLDDHEAAVAAERGQLVYQGRLDSQDFADAIEAVGVGRAIALSGSDHLDGYATERLARVIGSENLYGLRSGAGEDHTEPGTAHAVATRTVLPEVTAADIDGLLHAGYRIKVTPGHTPIPRWLTIGRIDQDGRVVFDGDPEHAADTDLLVQFGPTTWGFDPTSTGELPWPRPWPAPPVPHR